MHTLRCTLQSEQLQNGELSPHPAEPGLLGVGGGGEAPVLLLFVCLFFQNQMTLMSAKSENHQNPSDFTDLEAALKDAPSSGSHGKNRLPTSALGSIILLLRSFVDKHSLSD